MIMIYYRKEANRDFSRATHSLVIFCTRGILVPSFTFGDKPINERPKNWLNYNNQLQISVSVLENQGFLITLMYWILRRKSEKEEKEVENSWKSGLTRSLRIPHFLQLHHFQFGRKLFYFLYFFTLGSLQGSFLVWQIQMIMIYYKKEANRDSLKLPSPLWYFVPGGH